MITSTTPDASVYTDNLGLEKLKRLARDDSGQALQKVAEQFEAIFTQTLLKGMRAASFGDDLFGGEQVKFYQEMYDQQLATTLSGKRSMGLADLLVRQLSPPTDKKMDIENLQPAMKNTLQPASVPQPGIANKNQFVAILGPIVNSAVDEKGLPAKAVLAQAALETGWGKSIIQHKDGSSSYNLFGIKADSRWQGETVATNTLEYEDGIAVKKQQVFRSYGSYEESVKDYMDFIKSGPRYQTALTKENDPSAYVRELQQAGYATDPEYANKIIRVMGEQVVRNEMDRLKVDV